MWLRRFREVASPLWFQPEAVGCSLRAQEWTVLRACLGRGLPRWNITGWG